MVPIAVLTSLVYLTIIVQKRSAAIMFKNHILEKVCCSPDENTLCKGKVVLGFTKRNLGINVGVFQL